MSKYSVNLHAILELSSTGLHQECLQTCQQLLQSEPENPIAWKYSGKSLLALGQFQKAQQCLAKAHQLNSSDPETIKDIGNIFNALQNDAEAARLYKAALSIDPNYAPALNNLGMIAKRQGNLSAAEKLVKRACDLDPSLTSYHLNLGGIYKELGNLDQALASILKSLELKPDNPDAHMSLSGIYKNLGKLDQALASTLQSLKLKPDNPDAHMNLGIIQKDLGNLDQALASTLQSLKLKPDNPDAHMNLGTIHKDLGNLDQAITSTLQSLELKPDNPDAHLNLGIIHQDLGNFDQALASTLQSLKIKSDNPNAHINLGTIYFRKNEFDKAMMAFEKSLTIKKTAIAMMNLSKTCSELGKNKEGLDHAIGAVELDKNNERCLIHLAKQYQACGRRKQGIEAAMKAIEANEKSEKAYLAASELLCEEDLFANARQILERGKEQIKNNHLIDGELVRVKYLEGLLDDKDDKAPWTDDDDIYFENCNGNNLIISFGSLGRRHHDEKDIPSFNFREILKSFKDHDKIYIRDLDRLYYMNGIKNSAPSIQDLTNLILLHARAKRYQTVTTLGASSGGFGALLYGNLIKADYMIAFNPQTVLNEEKDNIIKDDIFAVDLCKALRHMHKNNGFYQKCLNIRNFIPFHGKAVIHYSSSSSNGIDRRYAEYLKHENCSIISHKSTTHLLALELKEKNMLMTEIAESINLQKNQESTNALPHI